MMQLLHLHLILFVCPLNPRANVTSMISTHCVHPFAPLLIFLSANMCNGGLRGIPNFENVPVYEC